MYVLLHSMNITLFMRSLLIEIILVPILAAKNNSSLNTLVYSFV